MPMCIESSEIDEALLGRAPKRRSMRVRFAEVRIPRVEVGVEVKHRHRPVPLVHGAQERKGDGVVAAERDEARTAFEKRRRRRLDLGDRLGDVEGIAGDVAGVCDLLPIERADVERGVVRPQQPGGLADVGRTEPCARPVADPRIKRDADDRDIGVCDVLDAR